MELDPSEHMNKLVVLTEEQRKTKAEKCGIYYKDGDQLVSYVPHSHTKSPKHKPKLGICVLQTDRAYAIRWHTHPNKFYPSAEDLLGLYRSKQQQIEIIYSTQGVWVLQKVEQKTDLFSDSKTCLSLYNRYKFYETLLYILGRYPPKEYKEMKDSLHKKTRTGGMYYNSLSHDCIHRYYIPQIKESFGIEARFYTHGKIPIKIDADKDLLSKYGAVKVKSDPIEFNCTIYSIPRIFHIEYRIDPHFFDYSYEDIEEKDVKKQKLQFKSKKIEKVRK